jgi:hypothetical protein
MNTFLKKTHCEMNRNGLGLCKELAVSTLRKAVNLMSGLGRHRGYKYVYNSGAG